MISISANFSRFSHLDLDLDFDLDLDYSLLDGFSRASYLQESTSRVIVHVQVEVQVQVQVR